MLSFIEIEELRKEAAQMAEVAFQSIVKRAPYAARNYYLDEGTYVKHVIIMLQLDLLDRYESTHVKALVFYVSRNLGVQEEQLTRLLQSELMVGAIENIRRKDYGRVVDFLRDIDSCGRLIERQAG